MASAGVAGNLLLINLRKVYLHFVNCNFIAAITFCSSSHFECSRVILLLFCSHFECSRVILLNSINKFKNYEHAKIDQICCEHKLEHDNILRLESKLAEHQVIVLNLKCRSEIKLLKIKQRRLLYRSLSSSDMWL